MNTTPDSSPNPQTFRNWAFAGVSIFAVASYFNIPDVSWKFFQHLFLGRWIIANNDIPSTSLWIFNGDSNFRLGGSWLFNLFIAGIDRQFGPVGVSIAKELLLVAVIASWALMFGRLAKDKVFGFLLSILLASGVLLVNQTTPGLIALALFVLFITAAREFLSQPCFVNGSKLFLLAVIYVNIHPSIFGAILIAVLVNRFELKKYSTIVCYFLISFLALFIRPYPFTQLAQFGIEFKAFIGEVAFHLDPVNITNHELGLLLALFAGIVFFIARMKSAMRGETIIALAMLLILGLSCKNYAAYVAVYFAVMIAILKPDLDDRLQDKFEQTNLKLLTFVKKIPLTAGVFFLFSLGVVFASRTISLARTQVLWPVKESEVISKNIKLFPLVQTPEVGSFLNYKLFLDNSAMVPQIIVSDFLKYSDYRLYLATQGLCDLKPGWRDVFSRINPNSIICPVNSPMFFLLGANPEWKMLTPEDKNLRLNNSNKRAIYALFARNI